MCQRGLDLLQGVGGAGSDGARRLQSVLDRCVQPVTATAGRFTADCMQTSSGTFQLAHFLQNGSLAYPSLSCSETVFCILQSFCCERRLARAGAAPEITSIASCKGLQASASTFILPEQDDKQQLFSSFVREMDVNEKLR